MDDSPETSNAPEASKAADNNNLNPDISPKPQSAQWEGMSERIPDSIHNRQIQFSQKGIFPTEDESDGDEFPASHPVEYPTKPPPAYSSGDHTPEERPLISDDDEVILKSPSSQVQGKSALSAMAESIAGLAATSTVMVNPGKVSDDAGIEKERDMEGDDRRLDHKQTGTSLIAPFGSDEKELLLYIEAYTAETIRIEPFLKPFLLDYIPAVGDVDAFIKIPRPDEIEDNLGLTVLDEPAVQQSDPTILGMQLRNELKGSAASTAAAEVVVKKLERADKNTEEIERWINSIKLHRSKPPDTVHYSKPMPNIEQLMQEWPAQVEDLLKKEQLPNASLDVSLEEYVDICLALLDIPVHKSRIQALHVLFTLFAEFRSSQHFRNLAENNLINSELKRGNEKGLERLELS